MDREVRLINMKTAILDAERTRKPITLHTHERRMIDRYACIDTPQKPITLRHYMLHGGLIYWKRNQFEWQNVSVDDIDQVEIDGKVYEK